MTDIIALDAKLGMRTSEWESAADRVTRKFERMIDQQQRQSAKAAREMSEAYKRGFGDIESSVIKLGGTLKGLGLAAAAALGVESLGGIVMMADKFNTLEQRVKTATRATGDFAQVNQALFQVAQRNGAAFSDTVEVFQRLAIASKSLGATNTDMIQLTDTVQKLGVIGGTSAEGMKAGLLQFGQAMSSGVVHAEEFNSLVENMPSVANEIASAMGLTTAELRKAVIEGKVLSKDVFDALQSRTDDVNKRFAEMPPTLARSKQALDNAASKFVSDLDQALGLTQKIAVAMDGMAKSLDGASASTQKFMTGDRWLGDKNGKLWKTNNEELATGFGASLGNAWNKNGGFMSLTSSTGMAGLINDALNGQEDMTKRLQMMNMAKDAAGLADMFKPKATDPGKTSHGYSGTGNASNNKATFDSMLKQEQEVTKEYALRASHKKEEAEVSEAMFKIEKGLHITLTEQQKAIVRKTVEEREGYKNAIEGEKKAAAEAKKRAEEAERLRVAYRETADLLDGQIAAEHSRAKMGEYQANLAEKRAAFEKQIAKYTDDQKNSLRQKFETLQKELEVNDYDKRLKSITEETKYIAMQGTALEDRIPLQKQLDELQEQGRLTEERRLELQEAFNKKLSEEADLRSRQQLKALKEQTEEMGLQESTQRLIDAGYYQQAEYMKEIYEFQKNVKREATDEEKAQISINTQQREYLRQAGQARELINSLQTAQQKWNKQAQDLRSYYENGFISLDQYRQAVVKLNPEFEKFRNMAKDVGDALSKGLDDWLTKGKKFTDVLKDIGKELASSAIKNLLVNPLQQGITNLGQNLLGKFVGAPTGTGGGGGLLDLLRAPSGSGLTQLPLDPQERAGMLGEMAPGYRMKIWGANPAREITPDMDSYPGIVEALQKGGYTGAFPKTVADYNRIASQHNAMLDAGGANGLMTGGLSTLSSKYGSAPGGAVPVWIVGGASMGGPGMVPMTGMLGAMNNAGAFGGGGVLGGRAGAGGIAGGSPWRSDEMTPRRWGSMTKGMQEQWLADTARHHATEILTGGNAYTPLEKSIAAVQYNGSGVWSPNQQFVGKGQSWGGGGGGFALSGWQEDGPTDQEMNIRREQHNQENRWQQGGSPFSKWGQSDGGSASRWDTPQHQTAGPWFQEGLGPMMGPRQETHSSSLSGYPRYDPNAEKSYPSGPPPGMVRNPYTGQWEAEGSQYRPEGGNNAGQLLKDWQDKLNRMRNEFFSGSTLDKFAVLRKWFADQAKRISTYGAFGQNQGVYGLQTLPPGAYPSPYLTGMFGMQQASQSAIDGGLNFGPLSFSGVRGYAKGGRPEKNKISMIGEDGPELWVPDTAGTVVPLTSGSSSGASRGASAPNLNVAIHNNTPPGYEVVTETRQTESGFEAHQTFRKRMQSFMRSAEGAQLMRDLYGTKRRPA